MKPALTVKPTEKKTCIRYCATLKIRGKYDEVLKTSGEYPKYKCVVNIQDNKNGIIETITQNGDKMSAHKFDSTTGSLIKKTTISR
ncbi:MAG: hypothetical protein U9O20_02820 [Patescibacteria group bacterium]|nr:hypothetical protein [Patescibacteria group bacterium]